MCGVLSGALRLVALAAAAEVLDGCLEPLGGIGRECTGPQGCPSLLETFAAMSQALLSSPVPFLRLWATVHGSAKIRWAFVLSHDSKEGPACTQQVSLHPTA